ncbi:lytic transglycosylase domain-containing protein [Streptomyces hygroscopicus]|uniref:lytic transglycosylase domain-containing protein n=1 Tax=Streptomyces hygroscopicus TaxID=1912 RepID=UPI00223EC744|nr:lytic transglycosylase domain-containing protein [Streptomyces hygroscopicus]
MAALTASQAPGAAPARASEPAQGTAAAEHGPTVSGDTPYRTDQPPLRAGKPKWDTAPHVAGGALPATVYAAYRRAATELARTAPGCGLRWQLLAAIGQVESGQAWGGRVAPDGTTLTPILGPRLDGGAFALVRDTDGGVHDGDTVYDRAVGPMQFIPSTWARWGADGNGDGRADPNNVFDAALAAGRYLCAAGTDLSDPAGLDRAILGYNHSESYLRTVRAWYAYFLEGHQVVPDLSAPSPSRPEPSRPGASKPATKPSGRPSAAPSPTPSAPAPSPTASRTAGGTQASHGPLPPAPAPTVTLPGAGALPVPGPLTSNGENTIGSSPSPTADTRR